MKTILCSEGEKTKGKYEFVNGDMKCQIFVHVDNTGLTIACCDKSDVEGNSYEAIVIMAGNIHCHKFTKEIFVEYFHSLVMELPNEVKELFGDCFDVK